MEYPGYGLYKAVPDAQTLLDDALTLYDYTITKFGMRESDVLIFGRSIGSSPSCYIASKRNPAGVILMSPFTSIKQVAKDLVGRFLALAVAERFRNVDLAKEIQSPMFIVHG